MKAKILISSALMAGALMATTAFAQTAPSLTGANVGSAAIVMNPDGTCSIMPGQVLVPCPAGLAQGAGAGIGAPVPPGYGAPAQMPYPGPGMGGCCSGVQCQCGNPGLPNTGGMPPGMQGQVPPGLPNTGAGGDAAMNLSIMLASGLVLLGGGYLLSRRAAF